MITFATTRDLGAKYPVGDRPTKPTGESSVQSLVSPSGTSSSSAVLNGRRDHPAMGPDRGSQEGSGR
eukprot:7287243-Heterocapsa_arctica.AAC.1